MEQDSYSVQEVIEALQSVGVAEEVIEYVVPIAAYESRVNGVPFTRDALDKESPSWGIFQANLNSMSPGIYKAMKELGVEVPGITEEQDKVLVTNNAQPGQENLLNFTSKQKKFVANWFKNEANLKDNALVFKYMLEQKLKDAKTNDFKKAMKELYVLTIAKFEDPNNKDAQQLKQKIEKEVEEAMSVTTITEEDNDSDRGIPVPEDNFDPRQPQPQRTPYLNPSEMTQYTSQVPLQAQSKSYGRVRQMLEAQVNKQKKSAGHAPVNTNVPKPSLSDAVQAALKLLGR
jgi:hypothetical protein